MAVRFGELFAPPLLSARDVLRDATSASTGARARPPLPSDAGERTVAPSDLEADTVLHFLRERQLDAVAAPEAPSDRPRRLRERPTRPLPKLEAPPPTDSGTSDDAKRAPPSHGPGRPSKVRAR